MVTKSATANGQDARPTAFINARLIDPATNLDEPGGLIVQDGRIADFGPHLRRNASPDATVVDCSGHVLGPGLVDMQVFTGEPGNEHRETLKTASRAAAAGGVTTIVVMPDTDPVIDSVALVDFINRRARDNAIVNVATMAAMTVGLDGKEITELGLLKRAGAVAFTNGKQSVMNASVMRNALLYSRDFGAVIVHHTEDADLTRGAAMNAGLMASRLGLPSVPAAAETMIVERDLALVEITGGHYHAANVTCGASVKAIAAAKKRGLPVTCAASINHLILNENDIGAYRTFFKVRPPLRSDTDRLELVRAISDGTIDIIVSSHDPQDEDTKRLPFAEAADGANGLETLLSAALRLHHDGDLSLPQLFDRLAHAPAKRLGLEAGTLKRGAPADLIVVDIGVPWMVNRDLLVSRSKNSPFDEARMQGQVRRTMVAGQTVYPFEREDRIS
ncbi:MAG: dihydroorotase [Pseudomonadota bacterium]